ncbi:hypothetical protein KP509_03G087300 [Ceratopteris richardii]|uniref:Uncharacterized protein n=1 Tax=Ceratopteris richardii TaxID=49495 RepID=A0A8T2V9E5_CERRI|nr:hypothetical protein KP509_03G087300 [Ceratopteris richardii]
MESQDRKSRRNVRAPALDEVHIYSSPQAVHASGSNRPDESHILQVDSRARGTSPTVPSTHRRSETGYDNPAEMPLHTTPNPADTHVNTEDDSHQILSARGDPSSDYGTAQNKRSYADQTEHNASVSGYSTLESSQKHRKEHIQHQIQLSNKNRNQCSPSRKHNTSPTREENVSSQRGHDRCPQNPSRSRSRSPQRRRSSRPQRERSRTPQRGTRVTESRSPQRERSRTQQRGTQKRGSSSPHRRHSRSSRREHYRRGSESPQRGRSRSPQRRQSTENRRGSSQRRHSRSPQNRQSTSPQNRRSTTPRNRCRSPRMDHTQSPNCDTHKMNPRDNLGLEHVHSRRRDQSPTHDGGISPSMRNSRGRSLQNPNLLQKSNLPNRYDQGRGQNNFDTESYRSPGLLNKSIIDPGKSLRRHDREPISSQGNYQCQGKDMKGSAERTSGSERHYNESARGRESSSSLHPKLCQQGPSSSHVRESHHQVRAYHFQDSYQRAIHGEDLPSAFGQGQGQTSTRTSNHENNPQHVREGHHLLVRDYHPQDRCQRKIHEEALSYASGRERVQTPTRTYHHESRHQTPSMHSVGMLSNLSSQGLVIQNDSKQQRTPTKAVPRKFTSDSSFRDKPHFSQIAQDRLSPYCPQENQVPEGRSHITQETQREKGSSYDQTASTLEHHVPYTATSPLSPKNWTDAIEAFMNPSFHLLGKGVGSAPKNRTKMRVKSPSSPKSSRGIHESPGSRIDRPQQYHEDCLIPVDLITSNNKDEAATAPRIKNPPSQHIQPATHDSETIHNSSPDDSPLCIPRRSHTTSFLRRITSPTNYTDDITQHIGDIKNAIENSNKMSPLQRYLDDDSGTKILGTQRGRTPAQKSETSKQRQPQYASKPEQKIDQNDPLDVHINSDKNKIKSKNIQTLYSESGYRILSRAKNQSVPSKTGQGNAHGAVIVNDRENAQEVPSALNSDTRMNKTKEKGTSHALNIDRAPSTMLHDSKTSNKNIQHIKDAKNNHGITQVFSNTNIINKDKTKQRKTLPPTMETKNETPTRVKQQISIPGASKLNTQPEENRSDIHSPHNDVSDKHREMKIRIQTPLSKASHVRY